MKVIILIYIICQKEVHSIEPQGFNTPYVESLSSYIFRLAESHNVSFGILMSNLLFSELSSCP